MRPAAGSPRKHQLDLLAKAQAGRSALLIAPTGAGKTLAGFLPTLVELSAERPPQGRKKLISIGRDIRREGGLHTLYISPLKALAVDIARNLETPVAEMGLPIRLETRTGDTPVSKRQRQRRDPPDVLLTTPEQVALLLASADAPFLFGSLKRVVLDELHSLVTSKRGDLLSLGLARLFRLAPQLTSVGLSATVAEPDDLCRFLLPQPVDGEARADLVIAGGAAAPEVSMLDTKEHLPWAGHGARHALGEIYDLIKRHKTTLIFVNTRSQAEGLFQDLWRMNDDNLAIALHHGSLDVGQRRRVEDAMAEGKLCAVVCTSSLDLGVDWGDVDLVINVGAPKGSSRLMQRIGRANHRLDEPSRAVLIPANRFEVLECQAALGAVADNAQDTPPARTGALDVLAQHVLGCAVGEPFRSDDLYKEVRAAAPYATLTRKDFDDVVDFVATGGYALKAYERFAKIRQGQDGRWRITHPRIAQRYRMNVGTIVEADMLKVRLVRSRGAKTAIPRGGRLLGQVEEYFIETLALGDTFVFAGEILRYETLVEDEVYARAPRTKTRKFPLMKAASSRFRLTLPRACVKCIADHHAWRALPEQVREWLEIQEWRSLLPPAGDLLVETFPRATKHLSGRLPVRRPARAPDARHAVDAPARTRAAAPARFCRQRICIGGMDSGRCRSAFERGRLSLAALFDEDMLGDDFDAWLAESALMKRTFRSLRHHRRADRAPLSGRGKNPPAGHGLHRSRLRRAAHA